ncbi:TrbI/VirB10 family protein [Legionella pneumophila serogroup 1]|uniref:TrbI/VirB10 family protein n=1 Tax=Legionella pneumophila TaxID=446 RepID=UPI001A3052C4|nr:TrbI/VirB10 family protein [Legionella pneumophila]MCH9108499.1 TrbI/VirB10 family protein [Legionella pneumophila serogroup 1]MCH9115247.1 TrbI/VirB10 family protein [Legionella pneumophila serogroup 1]MDW8895620.1 TrbI/VirB10 family protein [Legionella pneumophila]MDW9033726.1 TrbI/VirB10 family protein [Legionella pneumophila]MDW9048712.1 TrbI/VirB10 family protein [Legionella pneumophila]
MSADDKKRDDSLGNRTQVAKNSKHKAIKDKLLLAAIVVICVVIGIGGLFPKRKAHAMSEPDEKQSLSMALNQNLELIAALKDKNAKAQSGYKGGDPRHPPLLKTMQIPTVSKETLARMNAPSTFFSSGGNEVSSTAAGEVQANKTLTGRDANSEFLNQQNDITSVSAKRLPHPAMTVPAGEMIPATLETAINSELAGMVRAITTRDIFALKGSKLLIPKGSTLVGQFNTAITQGQSRIFVVWNRLQMTNGVIVTLNSPSSDPIGRSGQAADYIDRHFFERFGTGALLSVLGAYTATGGVQGQDEYNSRSQYRMNIASSFQQAANQTLQQDMQTRPTLQVNQGASINVFVAHDLDFYRVAGRA